MVTTPHAVFGATSAVFIPNPLVSLPLAFASHFVLDAIPHWQETLYPYKPHHGTWIRIPLDISLSLFLIYLIAHFHPNSQGLIWVNSVAANLPDTDSVFSLNPSLVKNMPTIIKRFINWHIKIQKETSSLWGLVPQLVLILCCLFFVFRF